jgi:ABC-type branched-subunit amino acid transport system substrate-binding protein
VAPVARQARIPVIAFSSDEKVAGGGVYLLSFLAGRDVPRIVSFAASRGKRNFAELVPQSAYGRIAEAAFGRAASSGGGQIAVNAGFPSGNSNAMLGPIRQVAAAVKGGGVDAVFIPAGREDCLARAAALRAI